MRTTSKILLLIASIITFANYSFSITYTTMANGNWNDVATVWSTDGGVTPCGCAPALTTAGDNIVINHSVALTGNLVVNGWSTFTINPSGTLSGNFDFNTFHATSDFFGSANLKKFVQDVGSTVNMHTGAILIFTGVLKVRDGVLNNDGGLTNSSGIEVLAPGTINMINSSRMHIVTGNMKNNGLIDICATCCMSSNGNWSNNGTGTVTGLGVVNSGGNLSNSGAWAPTVNWCAQGTALGLPNPENCIVAQGICDAIVLPVELVYFEASPMDDYIVLNWETATETDNDYFIIERSKNGKRWEEVDKVDGAGTSIETIKYEYFDFNAVIGDNYYRLRQVDFSGRETISEIVYASIAGATTQLAVYPNPTSNGSSVTVKNVQYGETVQLLNASGNVVSESYVNSFSNEINLNIIDIQPGVYFVNTTDNGQRNAVKLMITQ